jgi:hypothetical protein
MTHRDLVASTLLALSPHGLAWPNNTGALKDATGRLVRYGLVGSPDILACIKGRMVGIECKVGRDWQRHPQKQFAAALARADGIYILARSVEDVTARLIKEGLIDE